MRSRTKAVLAVVLGLLLLSCAQVPPPVAPNAHVPDMVARTLRLEVDCPDDVERGDSGGTAVRLGHHMVLTAKHITEDREGCTYIGHAPDGNPDVALKYVRAAPDDDVAMLAEVADLPPAEMVAPVAGEHVWAVGYPVRPDGDQVLTVTDGTYTGALWDATYDGVEWGTQARITAPIYFGNSGGGAWNDRGQLVGITVSMITVAPGMSYVVPVDRVVLWLVEELTKSD